MTFLLSIIFSLLIPQLSWSSTTKTSLKKDALALAQQAADHHTQKKWPEALIALEESLKLNPYRLSAHRLKSNVLEQFSFTMPHRPFREHLVLGIPSILLLVISVLSFVFFGLLFGQALRQAKATFTSTSPQKAKALGLLLLGLTCSALYLHKADLAQAKWTCLTEATSLYSGPNIDLPILKSAPKGACYKVQIQRKDWVSVSSPQGDLGWLKKTPK